MLISRDSRDRARREGFTLIELLVVVTIIGILAAIALPKIAGALAVAKEGKARGNLDAVRKSAQMYFATNDGVWPESLSKMYGPFPGGSSDTADSMVAYFPGGVIPENPIDGPSSGAAQNFVWNEATTVNLAIVGAGNDGFVYFNQDGTVVMNNSNRDHGGLRRYCDW